MSRTNIDIPALDAPALVVPALDREKTGSIAHVDFSDAPELHNAFVRLEPLEETHHDELARAAADGEVWKAWYATTPSPQSMAGEIRRRLGLREAGAMVPWAVIDTGTGRAVGMTCFLNLDPANRRLEIGATWLGRSAQGTRINPAAKLLLLERAFDTLGCIAVEFRTHWHNRQSRVAIERLGAKQDGVLRSHRILENGTVRDTVVYSILEAEWPAVRLGLEARLQG